MAETFVRTRAADRPRARDRCPAGWYRRHPRLPHRDIPQSRSFDGLFSGEPVSLDKAVQ